MTFPFNPGFPPPSSQQTIIGNQAATASPVAAGSADLVSAATNTGGIIITSLSVALSFDPTGAVDATCSITINGVVAMVVVCQAAADGANSSAAGGLCAIRVPAGGAVSYTIAGSTSSQLSSTIQMTWRAV